MGSRTILDFDYSGDIMSVFDTWAANEGFRLLNEQEGKRTYQKGYGVLVMPTRIEISQNNGAVHFETWIYNQPLTRLMTLFLTPSEMKLDSGGFLFVIPRNISRGQVNGFLERINQPLIK